MFVARSAFLTRADLLAFSTRARWFAAFYNLIARIIPFVFIDLSTSTGSLGFAAVRFGFNIDRFAARITTVWFAGIAGIAGFARLTAGFAAVWWTGVRIGDVIGSAFGKRLTE